MTDFSQGDVVKISGFRYLFLVVSKNAFIRTTGMIHVCPVMTDVNMGPVHIQVMLIKQADKVVVLCDQVKLLDPKVRGIAVVDRISYRDKMEVSDALQSIFEYD